MRTRCSSVRARSRTGLLSLRCALTGSRSSISARASLSPERAILLVRAMRFSTLDRSARQSSVSITSMSRRGSTEPSTCTILSSSKQRTTCAMALHSRILPKNWLPRPSPCEAPLTRPAMSTNSRLVGMIFSELNIFANWPRRSSGTGTTPTLGSIVQKGKLALSAPAAESALKSVDFPTLGSPTIPILIATCISYCLAFSRSAKQLGKCKGRSLARSSGESMGCVVKRLESKVLCDKMQGRGIFCWQRARSI
jgi:hypothetical protein